MNRIPVLFLFALAAAQAQAAPEFQRWQTPDGATVILVERHRLPIVNVSVTFKGAGQAGESEKGAAGFTAAMLDSGSEQYGENELRDEANRLGVEIGASAGAENAAVSFAALSRLQTLSDGLKLANQIIAHPVFDPAVLEREKGQAATALRQNLSSPAFAAARELTRLSYGRHPYANEARLEEADIRAITADTLKRHHRSRTPKQRYIATRRRRYPRTGRPNRGRPARRPRPKRPPRPTSRPPPSPPAAAKTAPFPAKNRPPSPSACRLPNAKVPTATPSPWATTSSAAAASTAA